MLEENFKNVVTFSDKTFENTFARWRFALVGKFLSKGFLVDFIGRRMRARWNVDGHFKVSSLSKRVFPFKLPSIDIQSWILAKGPWSLTGQLLALKS